MCFCGTLDPFFQPGIQRGQNISALTGTLATGETSFEAKSVSAGSLSATPSRVAKRQPVHLGSRSPQSLPSSSFSWSLDSSWLPTSGRRCASDPGLIEFLPETISISCVFSRAGGLRGLQWPSSPTPSRTSPASFKNLTPRARIIRHQLFRIVIQSKALP